MRIDTAAAESWRRRARWRRRASRTGREVTRRRSTRPVPEGQIIPRFFFTTVRGGGGFGRIAREGTAERAKAPSVGHPTTGLTHSMATVERAARPSQWIPSMPRGAVRTTKTDRKKTTNGGLGRHAGPWGTPTRTRTRRSVIPRATPFGLCARLRRRMVRHCRSSSASRFPVAQVPGRQGVEDWGRGFRRGRGERRVDRSREAQTRVSRGCGGDARVSVDFGSGPRRNQR